MAKRSQKTTATRCKEEVAAELFFFASNLYTASASRSIIDTASWLLQEHRTEEELINKLAYIIDQVLPKHLEKLVDQSEVLKSRSKGNNVILR